MLWSHLHPTYAVRGNLGALPPADEGTARGDVLTTYRMEQTFPHVYSPLIEHLGNTNVMLFKTGRNSVCAILK